MLEVIEMFGPGEYLADRTEGITRVEDLPKPKLIRRSRNYKRRTCPLCQRKAYRLRTVRRTLHDLGDSLSGRPRDIILTYSQHRWGIISIRIVRVHCMKLLRRKKHDGWQKSLSCTVRPSTAVG